jgi:hypothetical protein
VVVPVLAEFVSLETSFFFGCFFACAFGAALGRAIVSVAGGKEAGAAVIVPADERYTASASPSGRASPSIASEAVFRKRTSRR